MTPQGNIELPVDQTLRILTNQRTASGLQLSCASLPYRNYALLYKPTVTSSSWTSVRTNRSIGTLLYFTETNAARLSQPQGFYRVSQLP